MSLRAITILLACLIELVHGGCNWTALDPTPITDLRTPTPVTFTLTAVEVSDCQTAPATVVGYYTAVWNGITYTEQSPETELFDAASTVYGAVTFPDLLMTDLVPGGTIYMYWTDYYFPGTSTSTGYFYYSIAPDALTRTTAPTTTPRTAPTTTPTASVQSPVSTMSSSVQVGPIVGGVVGGIVAIAAIFALVWYKTRTHPGGVAQQTEVGPDPEPSPYPEEKIPSPVGTAQEPSVPRMEITEPISGRLRYDT